MSKIGEIVKSKREHLGFTMKELSKLANISPSFISEIENSNGAIPSEEKIIKIAIALNMSESEKKELKELAALERTPNIIKDRMEREKTLQELAHKYLVYGNVMNFVKDNLELFAELEKSNNFAIVSDTSLRFNATTFKGKDIPGYYIGDLFATYYGIKLEPEIEIEFKRSATSNCLDFYRALKKDVKNAVPQPQGNAEQVEHSFTVPVYESISAGEGCPCYGEIVDYFPVPNDIKNGSSFISYKVKGDSMEPEISSGDYVLVKLEVEPENGQLGVFNINDEYFVKRIKKYGDVKVLVSTNPNYKEIMASAGDVTSCLGKVVLVSKRY